MRTLSQSTKQTFTLASLALLGLSLGACGSSGGDVGQFDVRWSFASARACAVDEVIRVSYSPGAGTDIFPCENFDGMMQGLTGNIPLGSYDVTIEAGTGDGFGTPFTVNPDIPATTVASMLTFDGDVQVVTATLNDVVGPASFNVAFSVDFGLDDDGASPNCTQTDLGGLGISQQRVDVLDMQGGVCVALDLDGETLCQAPGTNMICVEQSVTQTLTDVPPGDYVIEVRGYKSGSVTNACWVAAYAFNTADSALPNITLGDLLVPFDTASTEPACQLKPSRTTIATR